MSDPLTPAVDIADRVRHLADAASALGHKNLARELHDVARSEEARGDRHLSAESARLIEAILVTLTELASELARIRDRL